MLTVANPIYDIVFKYLMEDERIAKTLLSALLKKNVVDVNVRRHEYTNGNRDNISMFRIDFAATIEEEDEEYAEMMYYYLIECGTDRGEGLSDEEFRQLMRKQYDEVMDGVY